jgi:uncharacterized protein YbbC (DUF1343 family)
MLWITLVFLNTLISSCTFGSPKNLADTLNSTEKTRADSSILLGNAQTEKYLPLLQGKNVAVVSNQTSVIKNTHLIDSLLSLGIQIKVVFAPEHGFRGQADNGEHISNETDKKNWFENYFTLWE